MGIVISGDWLLQNPLFAGEAGVMAYLPAKKISMAIAVTYQPEAFDDQGNYRNEADTLFRRIAELAPDDAPRRFLRNNVSPWHRKCCSSTTSTSRPRVCSARRSPKPATTSPHSSGARRAGGRPVGDVAFPDPTHYDVIVPLGARWPVYDEALRQTWVGAEMQMLRDAADAGVPTLGVCFGGQLLAQAFGGSVARSTKPEIGWYDVASDDESVIPGGRWFQWHFDAFTLPPGPPRSPGTRIPHRRSCSAGRSPCNSIRSSITVCWNAGSPTTATTKSRASASPTTNYVRRQEKSSERGPPHPRSCRRLSIASCLSAVSQLMRQRVLDGGVPEPVAQVGQLRRHHPLVGLGQFAGALTAKQ